MKLQFYPGWPLRYAHVLVDEFRAEHAGHGIICLWAEDDPAQVAGCSLDGLWTRVDEWATAAQQGFGPDDRALDAYLSFDERNSFHAELPFGDLIRRGTNGYLTSIRATKQGSCALMIEPGLLSDTDSTSPQLKGAFYLRNNIGGQPRNLGDVRSALTNRQTRDLERGLSQRAPAILGEPSGGYDFIVLAWPRHDREHDALVIGFQGRGDALRASAMTATPNDIAARQRRAGPDAKTLSNRKILIAGAGSVGGHVALALASSGVGTITLHDSDYLKTGNLARHVSPSHLVGNKKTFAVAQTVADHAPWTAVLECEDLPHDPTGLAAQIDGAELVIDCTGTFSVSAALAEISRRKGIPLVIGALFHQGSLVRVQRQAEGDTPIAARASDARYHPLPPDSPSRPNPGFLELGCTAPINNAPPNAVIYAAAEIASTASDFLTGRRQRPDERITVLSTMQPPFDRTGTMDPPLFEVAETA